MMPQILHIDLDGFFVAVERSRHPELWGEPVVIGGRPDSVGRVAAASVEARAADVSVGLPLREAAQRCPAARFLPGDLDEYGQVADAADAILRRAFAGVEWVSLDEAYVDAASLRPGVGGLVAATEGIQAALRDELQVPASCGLGGSKITARVASHLARPSGLIYVLPSYDRRFLAPLAIALLPGLPESLRASLISRGIETIGDLAGLSDDAVAASAELALWRRLASGDDDRVVVGSPCPRAVSVHITLEGAVVDADGLARRVRELARDLASQLGARRLLARQLTVRAVDIAQATHTGTISLTTAASSPTVLAGAAVRALQRALAWSRSVTRVSVRASSLCPGDLQPSLFASRDLQSRNGPRARTARGFRDLERILLAAGDRTLTRRAS
jgi:DNA polymerase-4